MGSKAGAGTIPMRVATGADLARLSVVVSTRCPGLAWDLGASSGASSLWVCALKATATLPRPPQNDCCGPGGVALAPADVSSERAESDFEGLSIAEKARWNKVAAMIARPRGLGAPRTTTMTLRPP